MLNLGSGESNLFYTRLNYLTIKYRKSYQINESTTLQMNYTRIKWNSPEFTKTLEKLFDWELLLFRDYNKNKIIV